MLYKIVASFFGGGAIIWENKFCFNKNLGPPNNLIVRNICPEKKMVKILRPQKNLGQKQMGVKENCRQKIFSWVAILDSSILDLAILDSAILDSAILDSAILDTAILFWNLVKIQPIVTEEMRF